MTKGKIKIIEVTKSNFKKFNNLMKAPGQSSIIKFYADWCGHCDELNPKWKQMLKELNKKNLSGVIASVNEKNKDLLDCDTNILGYPTIRSFRGGAKKKDYNGKREVAHLKRFVEKTLRKNKKTKIKKSRNLRGRGRNRTRKKKRRNRSALRERFFKMITNKF